MKITIATGLYPPEIGGPATYAAMLEAELPVKGITVNVVPFGWVRHYPKVIRHVVYAYKLWQESRGSEIIYALDPVSVGVPAMLVAQFKKTPFLVRLGGDYAWEQGRGRFGLGQTLDEYINQQDQAPMQVRFLAKVQTFVVKRAVKIIVPSNYLGSIVSAWGVNKDLIEVIYSSLYRIEVNDNKEKLRHQLSYTYPTIVSSGRLVPWKGFEVLIEVVAKLAKEHPQITLVVVGDGPERKKLEDRVAELKISKHVRFIDSISKDALGATIKAADLFVLNTSYEGLSHQLIEVMDLGTPIVTTKVGGNPELITDGVHGLLVPYNDAEALEEAILRVINHPESVERMTQSARARSKDFDKAITINQLVELLKAVKK
jgi:glycosyltransferase involved in cell wall biosynthesis